MASPAPTLSDPFHSTALAKLNRGQPSSDDVVPRNVDARTTEWTQPSMLGPFAEAMRDLLAQSQSLWVHQVGKPGLFSAPQLKDVYRTHSMSI